MLEGRVFIKGERACHKKAKDKTGEIFGHREKNGKTIYGVSVGDKDYEFYEHELEPIEEGECK